MIVKYLGQNSRVDKRKDQIEHRYSHVSDNCDNDKPILYFCPGY